MNIRFKNITGKKEVKGFNEEWVSTTPTLGELKITPLAQKKLGIEDGDTVVIVVDQDNVDAVYIGKGITPTPKVDEAGNQVRDERSRFVYEEGTGFGAIVREASPGSELVKVTAASGWKALRGTTEANRYFKLAEKIEEVELDLEKGDGSTFTTTLYKLEFDQEKKKMARGNGSEEEEEEEGNETDTSATIAGANSGMDSAASAEMEEEEV